MQTLNDKKHIPSLNFLRGIAALSVCCFHVLSVSFDDYPWFKALFAKGYLGLDLFFVISGFIIPFSMYQNNYAIDKFSKFILKRSVRIEPPYIISFLLIIAARILYTQIHNYNDPQESWTYIHGWNQFWLHFGYLNQYFGYEPYVDVYWTLAIEFQFYILMGILYPLLVSNKSWHRYFLFIISCGLFWFLDLHYNWFIFQYGFLFCTGVLIFLYTVERITAPRLVLLLGIVVSLMYHKNGLDVTVVALFATACILFIKEEWKITNFLGKISYSFYLTHVDVAAWFILFSGTFITNDITLRITAVFFAITFATAFYYLFERPALRFSKRVNYTEGFKDMLSERTAQAQFIKIANRCIIFLFGGFFVVLVLNEPFKLIGPENRITIVSSISKGNRLEKNERMYLQAANGKYLCTEDHIFIANRDNPSDWETYIMVHLPNSIVAFKTHEGLFLTTNLAHENEVESKGEIIQDWEKYRIEGVGDHSVSIKAFNGKYLSLDEKTNQVYATASTVGKNEKFIVRNIP
ncbi:MAG: acyltransferase family protein [Bacteroidia bacterium]